MPPEEAREEHELVRVPQCGQRRDEIRDSFVLEVCYNIHSQKKSHTSSIA